MFRLTIDSVKLKLGYLKNNQLVTCLISIDALVILVFIDENNYHLCGAIDYPMEYKKIPKFIAIKRMNPMKPNCLYSIQMKH